MKTQTPIDKNKRKAWRLKAEAKLESIQADIDKLEAKVKEASADGRLKFESVKKDLRNRYSQIEKSLEELQETQSEKWESIKSKTEAALKDMHDAYKKAKDRFRS